MWAYRVTLFLMHLGIPVRRGAPRGERGEDTVYSSTGKEKYSVQFYWDGEIQCTVPLWRSNFRDSRDENRYFLSYISTVSLRSH